MTLAGASIWESELFAYLSSHEENERGLLVEYQEAAAGAGSAAFSYLVDLIVEDEIRHHRLLRELTSALRSDVEMRTDEPAVPRPGDWGPDAPRVAELTRRLLDREHEDARELRRLAGVLEELEDVTLWPLLVRLMQMDTDKHIAILEFVRRQARSPRR
jgi:hypothetical protein